MRAVILCCPLLRIRIFLLDLASKMLSYLSVLSFFVLFYSTIQVSSNVITGMPYAITDFRAFAPICRRHSTYITVAFTVRDPDPRANSSTICGVQWPSNSLPPWNYVSVRTHLDAGSTALLAPVAIYKLLFMVVILRPAFIRSAVSMRPVAYNRRPSDKRALTCESG